MSWEGRDVSRRTSSGMPTRSGHSDTTHTAISRREFLRLSALTAAGAALAGCASPKPKPETPTLAPIPESYEDAIEQVNDSRRTHIESEAIGNESSINVSPDVATVSTRTNAILYGGYVDHPEGAAEIPPLVDTSDPEKAVEIELSAALPGSHPKAKILIAVVEPYGRGAGLGYDPDSYEISATTTRIGLIPKVRDVVVNRDAAVEVMRLVPQFITQYTSEYGGTPQEEWSDDTYGTFLVYPYGSTTGGLELPVRTIIQDRFRTADNAEVVLRSPNPITEVFQIGESEPTPTVDKTARLAFTQAVHPYTEFRTSTNEFCSVIFSSMYVELLQFLTTDPNDDLMEHETRNNTIGFCMWSLSQNMNYEEYQALHRMLMEREKERKVANAFSFNLLSREFYESMKGKVPEFIVER